MNDAPSLPLSSDSAGESPDVNAKLAVIAELGRRAVTGTEISQILTDSADLVRRILQVDYVNILELLTDGTIIVRAGSGWTEGIIGIAHTEAASAIPAAHVLRTQTPLIVEDIRDDPRFPEASLLLEHGVESTLNVALLGRDRPFGVLGAHSTQRRSFHSDDVSFLQSIANVLSAALERDWYGQRQRERYLQRAEQMMAVGQVAAGVAHELRNPLTAVKGLVQLNLRRGSDRGVPSKDLAVIEHEIRRMERTLQTFLDFARPPRPHRQRLSVTEIAERVFTVVSGRSKRQSVELHLSHPDEDFEIEADQDQLQQLLLNLVLNGLDAMPDGGTLEIEVRPPIEGSVELYVRDTGPGISADVLPKVFQTFVSSKETGLGLGLPVSQRIAEDHGGSLSAYNLPGGGACFYLRLPVAGPHTSCEQ